MHAPITAKMVFTAGLFFLLCPLLAAVSPRSTEIRTHLERAQQDLQAQRPDDARSELKAALRLNPNIAEAHANLGLIAYVQGSYGEAAEEFRFTLRLQPSLARAKAFLGLSEMHLGKLDEAKKTLEDAQATLKEPPLRLQVGKALVEVDYRLGQLDAAATEASVLETLAPNDPDVLYMVYRAHSAVASRALAALSRVAPDSARLHQILGESHSDENNYTGAIAEYEKALAISPKLPGVHFELGQALLRNGNSPEAEHQFELALVENPYDAHSDYELGEIYHARSDLKTAAEYYAKALQIQPDFPDAHLGLGTVLLEQKRVEEAVQQLRDAIRLDKDNATAHYQLARAYRELNRMDKAEQEMKTFLGLKKLQGHTLSPATP